MASSMLHVQEPRMSSSQVSFMLSEESRSSGVSALVSRLNSSNPGVEDADNEESRRDPNKTKEQKMQDTFPWIPEFRSLCQATVGCRNVKALEGLMNKYLEVVTPSVKDCYSKANRASKLKKNMKDILIFFHLYYQEVKEALEGSSYLDLMMPLVSMFLDMEIKASIRGKESLKKLTSRLTSSLYLFLDNSEEHMLDAILMTKNVNRIYQEICGPLLGKILNNISNPKDAIFYVRCLLTFKLWKRMVPDPEERKWINKRALQKLHAPPNLLECVKALGNVLPRIPKTKKNITLFFLQSNFNLKDACREFLKSVKKKQENVYSQSSGNVEIDKPLFFMSDSGSCADLLSEKDVEVDKSHNSVDLWSSISVDSIASPSDMLKELSSNHTAGAKMKVGSKKKRKLGKKVMKAKKKVKGSSGTKVKKKKKLKNSESVGFKKGNKKASKLKAKKKKKKKLRQSAALGLVKQSIPQGCENSQIKAKQISSQVEEANPVAVKSSSPILVEDPVQTNVKSPLPLFEEGSQVNVIVVMAQSEESTSAKVAQTVSKILEESRVEKTVEEPMHCDQDMEIQSSSKMKDYERVVKRALLLAKDQIKMEEAKVRLLDIPKTEKDQSDDSFENSKSDLFGGKPKDLSNKEVEVLVDHPKTEKMETSLSSPKQIFETTTAREVDETLGKNEKAGIVSTACVASQYDLNARMSSKMKEQVTAHQVSSISMEKIKSKAAEGKPNKLTDKSVLLVDDLATKTDNKVDQSDDALDDPMANLFIVEKTKDKSSEGKNQLDIPKTEKLDILPSSTKPLSSPILEISTSSQVDELLVKKEKVEVVSNVFVGSVGSQFDVKNIMSTEREETEQVAPNKIRTTTFEKKVNEAFECVKPYMLSGVSVLTSDDLVSKHESKHKSDIVFDNQKPNLCTVEKSKEELNKEIENLSVPISLVVEEKGDSSYEETKVAENAVPVSMYSMDMETCNSSMKEKCDDCEAIETSVVTKISHINTNSEVEIVKEHKETGKCSGSPSEEKIVHGDDGELLTLQQPLSNISNTGKLDVDVNMTDGSQYRSFPNVISADASINFEQKQVYTSEFMDAFYPQFPVDGFYSKKIDKDGLCFGNSLDNSPLLHRECNNGTEHPLELPILQPFEEKKIDEEFPKSFEASTPKVGMEKMYYSDVMSHSRQKELDHSSYDWNSSQALPTNASESQTSGSNSPCSESCMDLGEVVGQGSMEDCETVGHCVPSDRSSVNSLKFYNAQTYITSPELTPCSIDTFLSQNSYVSKVGDSYLGCAPVVMEDVGESAVSKLSSRDTSILEVPSSVPVNFCESEATSVELSSSRRTKLHHDERIDSQMASSKQVTEDLSVAQTEAQALNIPVISCPSSIPGDAITHETPLKTDRLKEHCNCAECSVRSLKVSDISIDSTREGLPLKKMKSPSKLPRGDRVGLQITGKEGAGEISMGQGRPSVRGTLSESNILGKSSHYSGGMFSLNCSTVPYTQSSVTSSTNPNIPSLSYPYTSTGVTPTQSRSQKKSALDFLGWNCTFSNCTHSSDSKAYPYIPKPSNYGTPNNCKSPNENFSEKEVENLKSTSDKLVVKTENEWKSPNEKLFKKIEESLKNTKYDLNSETSLPLKKRLKKATISYESAENIIVSKPKTSLVGFPSYPTTPMMSLAHIDFKENVFVRAWSKSKPSLEESRVVNHEICSAMSCPNPFYVSNQTNQSLQTSSYATNLVKGMQRNSAHCGKCAEKAVCSVCDSALYNSASSAGQINPSSSVTTYSCASSPSTKVNISSYNAQPALNSQYYSASSSGHYGVQQTTPVDCSSSSKPENAQYENESESKSNQSLSKSDNSYNSIIGLGYMGSEIFVRRGNGAYVADPGLTQLSLILNTASAHVEKQGKPRVEETPEQNQEDVEVEEEVEMELGDEIEVGEEVEVGGEVEVGEEVEVGQEVVVGEQNEGDAEAEVEEDGGRETPKYSIVQKSSPDSEEDANKETTRIMPFKIFLNKNKILKVLAKNSCSKCRIVDCEGDCHSSSSEVDGPLANIDHENNDNVSEPKSHRKRGRKSRSSRDGEECIKKSKRRKHPHPSEDSEFVMHCDKKRRRKHISR